MTVPRAEEWIHRLTVKNIREYAERTPSADTIIPIGSVDSRSSDFEQDKVVVADRFDGLLNLFGIAVDAWQDRILGAEGTFGTMIGVVGEKKYSPLELRRKSRGIGLGEFVMDRAYWAIPFEGDDDKTGFFNMGLTLEEGLTADLRSYGEQIISRYYIDPVTYVRLEGPEDELRERAEKDEIGTDRDVAHTINYSVVFSSQKP